VSVNDVESADAVFDGEEFVDEGAAHVVDFVHEIGRQYEVAAMIMHTVNTIITRLLMTAARENMDFMPATIQGRRQLRDVDADSTYGNAVQCLPRKQSDFHNSSP
jgi:hypothetical protein